MTSEEVRQLLRDLFEEEALALGGLVALHSVEDDVVWAFVRMLDGVRQRFARRLEVARSQEPVGSGPSGGRPRAHPAIERLLAIVREE